MVSKRAKRNIMNGVFLTMFSVSLGVLIALVAPYFGNIAQVKSVQQEFISEVTVDAENPYPVIDWDELLACNSDVVAWVYVPGTSINYPIVKAPRSDPDFYLTHNIEKNYNFAGTPYLDAECEADLSSYNSVVSGHSLINESMFSPFKEYSDWDFFDEHRNIYLLTPKADLKLRAEAVNVGNGDALVKRVLFSDYEDFLAYWRSQKAQSAIVADGAPKFPCRTFCFVTCSYQTSNSRTLVYAVAEDERLESANDVDGEDGNISEKIVDGS